MGRARQERAGITIWDTARTLEARAPEAIKVVVAENHAGAFEALAHGTERYGGRVESFNEDANKIVAAMLGLMPRRAPAFAFLDPEGSELEWPTVEAIAKHKRGHSPNKIEQLILFPTDMGFVRLAPDHPELVTRIYGHDRWKDIYARRESGQISAEEARGEYVRMYAEGPRQGRCQFGQSLVALGQNLEGVLARLLHDLEHLPYERLGDALMEKIAHRVHEDRPRALPAQRLVEPVRPQAARSCLRSLGPTRESRVSQSALALTGRIGAHVRCRFGRFRSPDF